LVRLALVIQDLAGVISNFTEESDVSF